MAENYTAVEVGLVEAVDTSYLLLTGMNILLMQAGFTALEAGGTRAKHVKSLLFKNFMDHSVGALAWFSIGWGLFVGSDPFASGPDATFFVHPIAQYPRLFQQFAFAATAATIVSGAVTGRCRLEAYVVLATVINGLTYPLVGHWAWSSGGWLYEMGFLDFAGSCVVHAFGGGCALAAAWMCGPRPGRFVGQAVKRNTIQGTEHSAPHRELSAAQMSEGASEDKNSSIIDRFPLPRSRVNGFRCRRPRWGLYKTRVMPRGFNPPLMVVGALMLYVAWFSFNAGSAGSIFTYPGNAARAAVNTMLAAGAASFMSMAITLIARVPYDIEVACNALLAGLVAITAPCGYIEPWAAVGAGLLASPLYLVSAWFVLKVMGVDDVLGAVSVHCTCGVFGTIWLGLTHPDFGLFYGHGGRFLGVQVLGSFVIPAFGAVTSFLLVLLPFYLFNKLSYSESEQLLGLDFVHFGGEFGKDVDLESNGNGGTSRKNSLHSDNDLESQDGNKSANSSFIEENPAGAVQLESNSSTPATTPRNLFSAAPVHQYSSTDTAKMARSFSTVTMEGRKNVHSELRRVLDEDPRMRHRFRAYLEVMHKDEGVAFWDEVAKWRQISARKQGDKKIREARRIIKMYCLETGHRQVNLASKQVNELNAALSDREELLKGNLFDAALEELFRDLKHDFVEFIQNTPAYWS